MINFYFYYNIYIIAINLVLTNTEIYHSTYKTLHYEIDPGGS